MRTWRSKPRAAAAAIALAGVVLLVAACGSGGGNAATGSAAQSAGHSTAHPGLATAHSGSAGTYLADTSGRALYLWLADGNGSSSCMGACARYWPPLIAKGEPAVSGNVKAADLGTTMRSDGSRQVTYKGHPLYYYVGDNGRGQTSGQGLDDFGAKWWLVAPSGTAITTAASSSSGNGGGYAASGAGASY